MATPAIIVNGVPGAGKTTLAWALRSATGLPLVAKDAIKEALADAGGGRLPTRELGALAFDALWSMVGLVEGPVIVESFWCSGRDDAFFRAGLVAGGVRDAVEVWCEASSGLLRERFTARRRHPVHDDAGRIAEWEAYARTARPISTFPVIRVDTSGAVDIAGLTSRLSGLLRLGA